MTEAEEAAIIAAEKQLRASLYGDDTAIGLALKVVARRSGWSPVTRQSKPTAHKAKVASGWHADFQNLLRDLGMSGAELARRVDVHQSTVSSWSTGRIKPSGAVVAYLKLLAEIRRLGR